MATALTDPEVRQFVERSEDFFPQDGSNLSIDQQRTLYDRLCAAFGAPLPDRLTVHDLTLADRPARHYQPDAVRTTAHLLFFHGGGFVVGGIESHDSICAELAVAASMNVFALDYRLAPEHCHPAAFEDALGAYLSLRQENPVIVAGDSAGGNLAAAVALAARDCEQPATGQLLIYPTLGGEALVASNREEAAAPLLTSQDMQFYQEVRSDGPPPYDDKFFAPLAETDYGGLPRAVLFAAEIDPLRDEAVLYAERLQDAGVPTKLHRETQLVHGYLRARGMSWRAADSFKRMVEALRWLSEESPL
ncbi:alpha/beta hydrolase [Limibacillus sp. MBR-115]|jgi:acetyl esterase|uniref:alpha/beta hydrolase n=1 Tax=Limibacillus sp. MBR-115 TaxID=3156465 RepID=UPI0033949CEB